MIENFLTIDVEEYFHVDAFHDVVQTNQWSSFSSRVQKNVEKILDVIEAYHYKATFFVLGWVAKKNREIVRKIVNRGHEIGCHSFWHRKVFTLSPDEFKADTRHAKALLEDISGQPVFGYRAPSYSITRDSLWAIDILEELGFKYDSSIFPIIHDVYGMQNAPRFQFRLKHNNMMEYPLSTLRVFGKNLPVSGGGYFRLFPFWFTKRALKSINNKEKQPFIFYLHPWELDPDQPKFHNARLLSKFRHYTNLDQSYTRFERLLQEFRFRPIGDHVL